MLDNLKSLADAATSHLSQPGWTGGLLDQAKQAVERQERAADRGDVGNAEFRALMAAMQAEWAANVAKLHEKLAQMEAERRSLALVAERLVEAVERMELN